MCLINHSLASQPSYWGFTADGGRICLYIVLLPLQWYWERKSAWNFDPPQGRGPHYGHSFPVVVLGSLGCSVQSSYVPRHCFLSCSRRPAWAWNSLSPEVAHFIYPVYCRNVSQQGFIMNCDQVWEEPSKGLTQKEGIPLFGKALCCVPMPRPRRAPRSHQEQGVDETETKITRHNNTKYSFCCGRGKAWQMFCLFEENSLLCSYSFALPCSRDLFVLGLCMSALCRCVWSRVICCVLGD